MPTMRALRLGLNIWAMLGGGAGSICVTAMLGWAMVISGFSICFCM